YSPVYDLDRNGIVDAVDVAAVSALLPVGVNCTGPNYIVIAGHDGHPDPDDNLAQLAGWIVLKRHAQEDPRIAVGGLIYCDTTTARKAGMLYPTSNQDRIARGNYLFHLLYGLPAILSVGLDTSQYADECVGQYNFDPATINDITAGGRILYNAVKNAIDANG